jgi:hypothetical protein
MALELAERRDQIALLEKESNAKAALIAKLDERISKLSEIAELHKKASADRDKALALKDQVEKLYRQSLADAEKQINRLKRTNKFWKGIAGLGAVAGFILGIFASK